ncbi:MAG TPA: 1,4-alpha-glucan branching protein GlgB [Actinomycetota bacterium]|nr:1,4-alpha-glucan branching protein GlgB [Actinomycetota bacterium]
MTDRTPDDAGQPAETPKRRTRKPPAEGGAKPARRTAATKKAPAAKRPTRKRSGPVWTDVSVLTDDDLYLFNEGTHSRLGERMGAHPLVVDGTEGTHFSVWAPDAQYVSVVGDFNGWGPGAHPLGARGKSGIWEGFVPGVGKGALYKFHIASRHGGYSADKTDPYGLFYEVAPKTAAIVWDLEYEWNDQEWMERRAHRNSIDAPQSIYEVHLGSWMRHDDTGHSLSYREIAPRLAEHVSRLGFTHVELLPVMEHPFFGSWGYQCTGFFAPTSRFGTPQDFMYLIDYLHQHNIGVILDWVPSHFPTDEWALGFYDGTHLYEHADPRQGIHPDWNSYVFNYQRNEVRSFLLSSAMHWLSAFHADGLRVDAVASMLYLDYSRKEGEWIPNVHGGRENLDAIEFLRRFNEDVYANHPDVQTYAEESTAWPGVSRPTYVGGLGFGLKWDMGWMHDTLHYFQRDPIHRRFHHNNLTFRSLYAFTENFCLPLSHDEVVHGKGSLLGKMPGDEWQRFANLRLLLSYMWTTPAKKLLFMGAEFGQPSEWNHDSQLEWHLLEREPNQGLQRLLGDLNRLYRDLPPLHQLDCDAAGFEWVDANDASGSVLTFLRKGRDPDEAVLVCCNFTPVLRDSYRVGVPWGGRWEEIFNSDAASYGGSGQGNLGGVDALPVPLHGRPRSLTVTLPPLGCVLFRGARSEA